MVDNIAPSYYAALDNERARFELSGREFSIIPRDAIGIISQLNLNPLQNLDTTSSTFKLQLRIVSDYELVAEHAEEHRFTSPFYIGAIVSADRSKVFWINNTRPIPVTP